MNRPRRPRSGPFVLLLAIVVLCLGATAALAQDSVAQPGSLLITEGPVSIGAEDDLGFVVVTTGDAEVAGTVDGIIVFNGDLTITGDVDNLAWSVTGDLTLGEGATVGGDAIAAGTLDVENGTVEGATNQMTAADWATSFLVFGILWWIGAAIATFVLGLLLLWLAPRGMATASEVGRTEPWPSIGIGLALLVGVPLASILIAFTLVGLPLTIALLTATAIAAFVGSVVTALLVGRLLLRTASPVVQLLVGLVLIGAVGVIPFVGGLVTGLAAVYGVGALAIAVWRARTPPTIIRVPETERAPEAAAAGDRGAPPPTPPEPQA